VARQQWRAARFGVLFRLSVTACRGEELGYGYSRPRPSAVQALVQAEGDMIRISPREYRQLYLEFNPFRFDAQAWVETAAAAGAGYVILTAKNHDGFCLWDTDQSDYKITSAHSPFGRDIVAEVAEACHTSDMRLGLYYSQRDWHHPAYLRGDYGAYRRFMDAQLHELLTGYGVIDILWLDSFGLDPAFDPWLTPDNVKRVREFQPEILVNSPRSAISGRRSGGPAAPWGDFETIDQEFGPFQSDRLWESRIAMRGGYWGYRPGPRSYTHRDCVHALVRCAAGDGNLLLGVTSDAHGRIEGSQRAALAGLGRWLSTYGETIKDTRGYPMPHAAWGGATQTSDAVYIHILDHRSETIRIPAFEAWDGPAEVLTGGTAEIAEKIGHAVIEVSDTGQDSIDTIIKLVR
jgi:alpha-L-fucosidase